MAKSLEDLSTEELRQGLALGEFEGRKAATAEEILRRRYEEHTRGWAQKFGWIGGLIATFISWARKRVRRSSTQLET